MTLKSIVFSLAILASGPAFAQELDFIASAPLHEAGLFKYWQLRLPLEGEQQLDHAYLVDDQLYLATQDGYVYAVDAVTGAIRWMYQVTDGGYPLRQPAHTRDRAIFVTPTTVLHLGRYTGEPVLRVALEFPAGSAAVSDGLSYYFGGINRRYYAYNLDASFEAWKVGTNGPITSTPTLFGDNLYVASGDGAVYAGVAANKKFLWRSALGAAITADLVADERGVYVASLDQSLYLLDLQFGGIRWRARLSGPLYEPPVLAGDVAYQYCPEDGVVAVNTPVVEAEERIRWKLARGRKLLTVDDRHAFVLTHDDSIAVVKSAGGELDLTIPAAGLNLPMPQTRETAIYLASPDGRVFCARSKDTPFLRADAVREALAPPAEAPTTTQPAATTPQIPPSTTLEQLLREGPVGPPVGGKSKVSRGYGGSSTPPKQP